VKWVVKSRDGCTINFFGFPFLIAITNEVLDLGMRKYDTYEYVLTYRI